MFVEDQTKLEGAILIDIFVAPVAVVHMTTSFVFSAIGCIINKEINMTVSE